ncbi:MAG TPA: alpha-galactosidase [Nakamurella sp.]
MAENPVGDVTHLRAAGVSVLLDSRAGGPPAVVYWGPDLGDLSRSDLADLEFVARPPVGDSAIDAPERVAMIPQPADGWVGRPGVSGSRQGADFSPGFRLVDERPVAADAMLAGGREFASSDATAGLDLLIRLELARSGLLRISAELTNTDPERAYDLDNVSIALPVPAQATELMDLTGRHARERVPQRREFTVGTSLRESRQGRPGLDGAVLQIAGSRGFDFTSGSVWGIHLGWSGNQQLYAERMYNGRRVLGAGELLLPGEVRLDPGESYRTPWVYASCGVGLNEFSGRFHEYLRSRPQHPRSPRPVLLNTWEAVYFRQDPQTLIELADAAADAGAQRFVLDDGWFRGRRDDHAGLGDWYVDSELWPNGLHPLVDHVRSLGMEFGLWVEPEMINLDSDLARAHPEWIFRAGGRTGIATRHQYVLDLGHPGAYDYIAERLHSLLDEYPIAYLKWDHNRMVVDAGHGPAGTPGVHRHTLAVYRLLDELRARHPELEIESCAGGGGRVDLGILERTDRVWASDCIDALERQQIQRYTQLLLPPELIGTHVGAPTAHTTHRTLNLGLRAGTAIWGHLGIEWNLLQASDAERAGLADWVALHKELRPLLHSGRVVVVDHPDPAVWVSGVIAQDGSDALFGIVTVDRSLTWPPGPVRLPGLIPDRRYRLEPVHPADVYPEAPQVPAGWGKSMRLSGRALGLAGVQIPAMFPGYLHLLRVTAEPDGE